MRDKALDRRIVALESQQRKQAGASMPGRWYELLVAPSCPPDRRLHIRGGVVTPSPMWLWIMQGDFVPDMVCDFDNIEGTALALSFSNVYWYLPIILCYRGEWVAYSAPHWPDDDDPPYFDCLEGTEVATPEEAEAQIDAWLNGYTQWYYYVVPLTGVVFRNDGILGETSAIQPIDPVNRGRSYLYRDARMRFNISG